MSEQAVNELSTATPALTDYIMGMSGTAEYKALVSAVAKKIVEDYAGSSLAGSNQSVKAALDSLNSNIDYTDSIQLESGVTKTSAIDSFFYRSGNVCTLQLRIQINATTTANTKLATLPIAPKVYANNANGVVFRAFNIWGANTSDVSCYIKPNGELWVSAGMTQQADYLFNVTFMA